MTEQSKRDPDWLEQAKRQMDERRKLLADPSKGEDFPAPDKFKAPIGLDDDGKPFPTNDPADDSSDGEDQTG